MKLRNLVLLLSLLLVAIGCGGGGVAGGGAGNGALFMTDSLDDHDHVWITVKKVVLHAESGDVTAFDDAVGKTIDLKTLRDSSGERYSFLASVPAGTYTGITVTVDKTVTLFSNGSTTGVTREFAGNNGSTADLSLTFATPKALGPGLPFALDFHLSGWEDNGTTVTGAPFLAEGQGDGLHDGNRHEREDYNGAISGLSGDGPVFSFTLSHESHSISVVTTADTVIFNANGSENPTLANGKHVQVRGLFSLDQNAIVADSIKIEGVGEGDDEAEVKGTSSEADALAGTFIVTIDEAHHFLPTSTTVNVVVNESTVLVSDGGLTLTQSQFFEAMPGGSEVEVEGSYDPETNTLTATKARLEDGEDHEHVSMVRGPISALNADTHTFDVTAQHWEGIHLGEDHLVHVVTNGDTLYGEDSNAETFFSVTTNGSSTKVEGNYNADTHTLTATHIYYVN